MRGSRWIERLRVEEVADAFARARALGLWGAGTRAALFHDLDRVKARLAELVALFPAGTLHAVAIKANPLVELLRLLVREGAGLEAASMEEVALALAAGCPAERVVFDSPAKTEDEIAESLRLGLCLNIDNLEELARVAARMPSAGAGLIGLRVNPQVGAGAIAALSVASRASKFGVPIEQHDEILRAFEQHSFLRALHVHVGSQGMPLSMLTSGVERMLLLRKEIEARVGAGRIETLDIGGGLPVAYRASDPVVSLASYVEALRALGLFEAGLSLVTELGRSIHATAGFALSRVEYVKEAGEERMAVLHVGADLLLRVAYRPDQWFHELVVFDANGVPKEGPLSPVTVVGPLCFAGDVLARGALLPRIEPGDHVAVLDVGAYTLSMWSRHCSRAIPMVIGVSAEGLSVLREAESLENVVAFWSKTR